jgi:hypothetical protein
MTDGVTGKTICTSYARLSHILLNFRVNKRAEDIQNCTGKGI